MTTTRTKFFSLAITVAAFGLAGTGESKACMALGQPKITVKLDPSGTGRALISEYNCFPMVAKTNCVVGVRLSDAASAESKIAIQQLRFVNLFDGSPVQGFAPAPNQRTTAAWAWRGRRRWS